MAAAIGIDTHKATLAACCVDELGTAVSERTFDNAPAGHRALLDWAAQVGHDTVIGIEGSASFGAPLARFLMAAGLTVREVPPQLSRRERIRTRRAGKSDSGDAVAIARVAARESDLPPVRSADASLEVRLLVEAREDVVAEMTRVRNRLHADLRTLLPGYGVTATNLTAIRHQRTVGRLLRPGVGSLTFAGWASRNVPSTLGSARVSPVIRCSNCPEPVCSSRPSWSARSATSAGFGRPTPSPPWLESPRSRQVQVRPSGCGSTAAAIAS
jgi:hypothetical protein